MEYDKITLGAYNLHFIKTERFKTIAAERGERMIG